MTREKFNEIYEFLHQDRESLLDLIKQDMNCNELDNECSCIYDMIQEEYHNDLTFENIVDSVINRLLVGIESFVD